MEKISKNYYKGDLIKNTEELIILAEQKKSIYTKNWGIKPASVIINMSFKIVIHLLNSNLLYNIIK